MSSVLSNVLSLIRPTCWTTKAPLRLFSVCRINFLAQEAEETRKRRSTIYEENQRLRMMNDPEYRERRMRQLYRWRTQAYRKNDAFRARQRAQQSAYRARHREKNIENSVAWQRSHANDDRWVQRHKLSVWLRKSSRARTQLTWKTHEPVMYGERVEHLCSGCELKKRVKLWWRSKTDPTKYDCFACFVSDWSRALPIGYENHDFKDGPPKGF